MDLDQYLRKQALSRRRFLTVSGVTVTGGSVAFISACGDDDDEGDETTAAGETTGGADVDILNDALALELSAVFAYTAGAELIKEKAVLDVGRTFLAQEQEHADGLTTTIEQLGGTPVESLTDDQYAEQLGLGKLKDQTDVLEFAVDLENTAVAAYVDAIPKLSTGDLRQTAAQIVTNEAEHISVLLGALELPQVPDAFVTGKA
jgi:rubrerythrin